MSGEKQQRVSISLLGGFSIGVGDAVLTDGANRSLKLWSVLAYLVVHRDRTVSQTELIEQFWPGESSTNPASALKTLLHRVRAMLEPFFGPELEPILAQRGGYAWNKAIRCQLDTERFAELCHQAEEPGQPEERRMEILRQANALYRGDFLPKLSCQLWVIPIAARYHELYLESVKHFASMLDTCHGYEEMTAVCTRAGQLEPLDEEIQILLIRSLLHQGKADAALAHYEAAVERLSRGLGVAPSEEMRQLYVEVLTAEHQMETDLTVIQRDLRESAARPGPFICEYGYFKEAYRLEARRAERTGVAVHVALLTVSLDDGTVPQSHLLIGAMDQLLAALAGSLRRGDVVARYSASQYVVMLHAASFENSSMVMERVSASFYQQNRRTFLKLSYKVRALE